MKSGGVGGMSASRMNEVYADGLDFLSHYLVQLITFY